MNKVLVVDDALTIRQYYKNLLEEIGLHALEAENGVEAMEKIVENEIGLCLVDVNMPIMDGYAFIQELRQGDYHAGCPVIMISTEAHQGDAEKGYAVGANLYLVKPAAPQTLQAYCQIMMSEART